MSRAASDGFTFLEVLVALLVTTILVATVAITLSVSRQAEELSRQLREARHALYRLQCLDYLGADHTDVVAEMEATWYVASALLEKDGRSWLRWELSPVARPALTTRLFLERPEDVPAPPDPRFQRRAGRLSAGPAATHGTER